MTDSNVGLDLGRILGILAGVPVQAALAPDAMPTFVIGREHLSRAFELLRYEAGFETATFVTAVDHHPATPRFEVCWQFLSLSYNERVRMVTRLEADDAVVPTSTHLWPGNAFAERECYDMFGIRFEGHENLRRLLMPEAYGHYPLRKDFPHHGIEPDRLYREWDARRRADSAHED